MLHAPKEEKKMFTFLLCSKPFVTAVIDSLPEGVWSAFIDHPFVRGIADGTLPVESFVYYLKQDYLYLQHYARAAALAAYKGTTMEEIGASAAIVAHIAEESKLHIEYCARFGITKDEVINAPESVFNSAYTRYVLDKGTSGDLLDLRAAMAPCLLGYGEIGLKLFHDPATKRGKKKETHNYYDGAKYIYMFIRG